MIIAWTVIFLIFFILIVFIMAMAAAPVLHFRQDKYNPYTRWCKACGQRQDEHGYYMNDPNGWYEAMGEIKDEKCWCHKFCKK